MKGKPGAKVKPTSCAGFPTSPFDPAGFRSHLPAIHRLFSILYWSLPLFRIRGIQLAVHWTFFLLLAYTGYEGWLLGTDDGLGWESALINVAIVVAMFTCVLLHELGHCFTAMSFGIGVRRILLLPIGGMAEFESIPREPGAELLITLGGPAVNFVIAGALYLAVGLPPDWEFFGFTDYSMSLAGFAQLLLTWNLAMGLFNLLPSFPMDGGRILRAGLATFLPYLRATYVAAMVGKILAGTVVVVLVYSGIAEVIDGAAYASVSLFLAAALFTFIMVAGELEYRAALRRDAEDAYWQRCLARHSYLQPSLDAPPLPRNGN